MGDLLRNEGPVIVGFVCAIIVIANYYFSSPVLSNAVSSLRNNTSLLAAFASGLGAVNLINVNYKYITTRRKGLWMIAPIYLVLFPINTILGIYRHPVYDFLYSQINMSIGIALGAFVGFFLVQGVYRTLRIKNVESLLLVVGMFLVILRKAPIGSLIWSGFVPIGDWLLFIPVVGGIRALIIIYGFGIVSIGIRTILGYERTQFGILAAAKEE